MCLVSTMTKTVTSLLILPYMTCSLSCVRFSSSNSFEWIWVNVSIYACIHLFSTNLSTSLPSPEQEFSRYGQVCIITTSFKASGPCIWLTLNKYQSLLSFSYVTCKIFRFFTKNGIATFAAAICVSRLDIVSVAFSLQWVGPNTNYTVHIWCP